MQPRMRYGGDAITVGGQARALAFAPGSTRLVALGNHHTLRVWDLPGTKPVLTLAHPGLGSHTALGFADRDTAVVHLDQTFARVHLAEGRIEPIATPPQETVRRIEGVIVSPGARFAVVVRTGPDYAGTHSISRYALTPAAAVETALSPIPPRDSLGSLGLAASSGRDLHVNYNAAAIRADGSVVAIGVLQTRVWVIFRWTAAGELEPLLPLPEVPQRAYAANAHSFFPSSLHLHPDGRHAVICRGEMNVLDLVAGKTVSRLETSSDELRGDTYVDSGGLFDEGRRFAAATRSGVGLWDVASGALEKAWRFDESCFVLAAAVSDTGKLFAGGDDRGVILHNLPALTPAHSPSGHRNPPRVLALCPRGRRLASSDGKSLKVWHLASGELAWDAPLPVWASMVFSPDGERLFADGFLLEAATGAKLGRPGTSDGTAHAWSADDGRLVHVGYAEGETEGSHIRFTEGPEMAPVSDMPEEYLRCVPVISANGRRAILSSETVLYGYDMESHRRLWRVECDVATVALSPDGALVAVTLIGGDGVRILDAGTGEPLCEIPAGRRLIQTIAFGAGDRIAIPGENDGSLLVLTIDRAHPDRAPLRSELTGHAASVCGLTFGRDGTDLVSSAEDGSICLWKL